MFEKLQNSVPALIEKFKRGAKAINDYRNKHGKTIFLNGEIERFEREVVAPLDAAWNKLSESERAKILNEQNNN